MKRNSLLVAILILAMSLSLVLFACNNPLEVPTVDAIEVEFAQGAKLKDVELSLGFSWVNGDEELVFGSHDYDAIYTDGKKSAETKITVVQKPSATMVAEDATIAYIEKLLKSDAYKKDGAKYESTQYDQYVMILARSYKGIAPEIKSAYMARVKDLVAKEGYLDNTTNELFKMVESAWGPSKVDYTTNVVMTLLALKESTVVDGVDLAAPFYNKDFAHAAYAYALNNNINVVKNLTIPEKYTTKDGVEHTSTTVLADMVTALLATQKEGGSWETANMDYSKNPAEFKGMVFDVDTATFAVFALADIKDNAAAKTAIDKVVADIKANIRESGSISYFEADNVSGTATAIIALSTQGIDAATVKNGEKSLLGYLDTCKSTDGTSLGGYGYGGFADDFSTKDAAIALISYNRMLRGEANFYAIK